MKYNSKNGLDVSFCINVSHVQFPATLLC